MSMISDLIKGLRKLGNQWKHNDVAGSYLIFEACDTIETLSAKVRANNLHGGWIPVSERLPEELMPVLVAIKRKDRLPKWVEKQTYHYVTSISALDEGVWDDKNVVAWMPLPKPYKSGDNE